MKQSRQGVRLDDYIRTGRSTNREKGSTWVSLLLLEEVRIRNDVNLHLVKKYVVGNGLELGS